jgi:hypothetical protein
MAVGGIVLFVAGFFVPLTFFRQSGMEYLAYLKGSDELKVHEKFTKLRLETLERRRQQAADEKDNLQRRLIKLDSSNASGNDVEIEKLENRIKEADRQIESIVDASYQATLEFELKQIQTKSEETVSINQRRDSRLFIIAGWVIALLGALLTCTGLYRWNQRVQVFEDRKLKKEADDTHQITSQAEDELTYAQRGRSLPRNDQINRSVDELKLSVRSHNSLKNADSAHPQDFDNVETEDSHSKVVDRDLTVRSALIGGVEKSSSDSLTGIREFIEEESTARDYVTMRYRTLIDQKYVQGLSSSEESELKELKATLDKMDRPYYASIIKRLRELIENRETDTSLVEKSQTNASLL